MSYKTLTSGGILRLIDGATVPVDPRNVDYQEYLEWVSAGNDPLDPDVPEPSTLPDFQKFLDLILVSNLYQSIVQQSVGGNAIVNTGLTLTMGNLLLAVNGKPNVTGLQAAINLLFSGLTYNQANIAELTSILAQSNLTNLVTIPIQP
jgi:hypothetical protein